MDNEKRLSVIIVLIIIMVGWIWWCGSTCDELGCLGCLIIAVPIGLLLIVAIFNLILNCMVSRFDGKIPWYIIGKCLIFMSIIVLLIFLFFKIGPFLF